MVYCLPLQWGQLLKEKIHSSRSIFLPLWLDPISESYLVQRSKQEFMQVDKTLFSEKRQGAFIRTGGFTRINTVF